jgi:DNA-directed RNA polymerase specialized sigma24 family protein
MKPRLKSPSENRSDVATTSKKDLHKIDASLLRYRCTLNFLAHRVLGNQAEAELAVERCLALAARSAPSFEHEGSFRSWLVRVLLDEALAVLREKRITSGVCSEAVRVVPELVVS